MSKYKKKITIVLLIILFAVLFYPVFKYNYQILEERISPAFSNLKQSITELFSSKKGTKYEGPAERIGQRIVEEESETINVIEKVSPSVVSVVIKTIDFDFFSGSAMTYESGIGTGFIVDSNGLVITNSHVVDRPAAEYSVVLKDGTTYEVDKIHLDSYSDIAILEITARNLPTVEFGDSDSLKVGQRAIAIGNALGRYDNTVTVGVVSGIAREVMASSGFGQAKTYEDVIQTDAALNPGNSGGPLLNSSGQVIGVNVATTMGAENIGFAIPVNVVKPILASFIENGRIIRPYLGVTYVIITREISELRNMPEGAFVSGVVPESPADEAGLQRGDIILKINDEEISGENTLAIIINKSKV
ncbi:trypsin-like peptidase domain-containing protein, partial [Patescibacteria group bacterium]|nr:trypsin-like peptidase domain-containing protein [Patescibacteria group bacterium]